MATTFDSAHRSSTIYRARDSTNTDFTFMARGQQFPTTDMSIRNRHYTFMRKLFTGEYAQHRSLTGRYGNEEKTIPYNVIAQNYFALLINRLDELIFSNDVTVKTGDAVKDEMLQAIIERSGFIQSLRKAVTFAVLYGDCIIRTSRYKVNVISPTQGLKIVNPNDKTDIIGIALYEHITPQGMDTPSHIRFEVHSNAGTIFEIAFSIMGTQLGDSEALAYRGRVIPVGGRMFQTESEGVSLAQWLSVSQAGDIYGKSAFEDIKDVVFALETLMSENKHVVSENTHPFLVMSMNAFIADEETGSYELKEVNGRYLIRDDQGDPKFIEWGGENLKASATLTEQLKQTFYELSEMSKVVVSGEYKGSVTNDTLQTAYKGTVDRAHREIMNVWDELRKSAYTLARLNGIDVKLEDVNVVFDIGRSLTDKEIAENMKLFGSRLSHRTMLMRYFGYTDKQVLEEQTQITLEQGGTTHGLDRTEQPQQPQPDIGNGSEQPNDGSGEYSSNSSSN